MIKVALIGEDPNDTESIKNLLLQKHSNNLQFKQLIKNKKGYQLNNSRVSAALKIEFEEYNPHHVLFIRDADALPTETAKITKVNEWFGRLNNVVTNKGILLINIYELEALIVSDIEVFNKLYNTSIKFKKNVMFLKEPKEFLIHKTIKKRKTYSESHAPEIFKKLNFETLLEKCEYFNKFYEVFKNKLN